LHAIIRIFTKIAFMPSTSIIKPLILFLIGILIAPSCALHKPNVLTKKIAPAALKCDAGIMEQAIMKMHPAVGIYSSRAEIQANFDRFNANLTDSLTQKEFRLRVKLLVDELHCGHTEVLYSKTFYKQVKHLHLNYSPYIFLPVKEHLYVLGYLGRKQDSLIRKGMLVQSINGFATDSILNYSKRFVSTDGFNRTAKSHYVQLSFNSYLPVLFGRPDTFQLVLQDTKALKSFHYPAVKLKNLPDLPLGPKDDSLCSRYKRAKIRYRYLDDDKATFLMKIEKFSHAGDARAYRRIFRKLKTTPTQNLVIDLRNNGGGSLANSYRLLSYLLDTIRTQTLKSTVKHYPLKKYTHGNWTFRLTQFVYTAIGKHEMRQDTDVFVYRIKPRKKNHFDGKIFVLINGGSFSASCLVAAYLKSTGRATFIGEETGGAEEGCNAGITPFYELPNSGIRVRVPAFRVDNDVCKSRAGRGIRPDYEVDYQFKDVVARKDLELMKVKALLGIR
jgi:hypothetical protein